MVVDHARTRAGGLLGAVLALLLVAALAPAAASGQATVNTAPPGIVTPQPGKALVGDALVCTPGSWQPAGVWLDTTWLRNGDAVVGYGPEYTVVAGDAGHRLSCREAAYDEESGAEVVATSAAVPVELPKPKLKVTFPKPSLNTVVASGFPLMAELTRPGTVKAQLKLPKATARKLRLRSGVVARVSQPVKLGEPSWLYLKVKGKTLKAFKRELDRKGKFKVIVVASGTTGDGTKLKAQQRTVLLKTSASA
jgi:hypothetical protein